jgi:hypothetical protein
MQAAYGPGVHVGSPRALGGQIAVRGRPFAIPGWGIPADRRPDRPGEGISGSNPGAIAAEANFRFALCGRG